MGPLSVSPFSKGQLAGALLSVALLTRASCNVGVNSRSALKIPGVTDLLFHLAALLLRNEPGNRNLDLGAVLLRLEVTQLDRLLDG